VSAHNGLSIREQRLTPQREDVGSVSQSSPSRQLLDDGISGFLGPASYSAILLENAMDLQTAVSSKGSASSQPLYGDSISDDFARRAKASAVLQQLPDFSFAQYLLQRYFDAFHPMDPVLHKPTSCKMHESFWKWKSSTTNVAFTTLPYNASQSAQEMEGAHMIALMDGTILCWETLAILFAMYGLASITVIDWDPLRQSSGSASRIGFATAMSASLNQCIQQCDLDKVNILQVTALYLRVALEAQVAASGTSLLGLFVVCRLILRQLLRCGDTMDNLPTQQLP
jgi:hypothetical protein